MPNSELTLSNAEGVLEDIERAQAMVAKIEATYEITEKKRMELEEYFISQGYKIEDIEQVREQLHQKLNKIMMTADELLGLVNA